MCYIHCIHEDNQGECTLPKFLPNWLCPYERETEEVETETKSND